MRLLVVFLTIFLSNYSFSQIIDTLKTEEGTMLIYSNRTWEYMEDRDFDGVLNRRLYDLVEADSNLNYIQGWDSDVCYTSDLKNNVNSLKDTFWLCVQEDIDSGFVMPFDGRVTSRYGWRKGRNHNGTDIDLTTGDTVLAAWSGKVRYAKFNTGGFGNLVVIRHHNGLETFYAHLSKLLVTPNQTVKAGDPIGLGGNTGHSYGSHLHFEVRFYDIPMNPENIIDFKKKTVKDENLFVHRGLFKAGSSVSSGNRVYHRVRSGDTLGAIARRNRTSVSRLCSLNGIRSTTVLQIGQRIRVR
ncbi:MAG: peptidoglycan DD-metalloendopeptidase family protein [Crocinitomicaceae bacterium]|nr:peptidoglycan DD-metalloendopeptidase family protein [Crocinitomicaceae bacterium]MDG1777360.1 peptidoglycan DD-metalloendopeptidase family protein [Crocinitomicaceae bacterium]